MQHRRFRLTALAAFLALGTLAALPLANSALGATAAPAAPTSHTVCLKNASSECADVKNDSNKIGVRVWLYTASGAKDDKWVLVASACGITGVACDQFQDAADRGLCMAADGSNGAEVTLQSCEDDGSWYNAGGNRLGNGAYGQSGELATNGSATEDYVYANGHGAWLQWTW